MVRTVLDDMLADVTRFHSEILGTEIPDRPTMLTGDALRQAKVHLREEFMEFKDARTASKQADALVDLTYVALGRLLTMGIAPGPIFTAVHEANMRKVAGHNPRRPGFDRDAVKPEGWEPPDLEAALSVGLHEIRGLGVLKEALKLTHRFKILVIGHGGHGKDTVSAMLRDLYGFSFTSSSMFCAERVIMPAMAGGRYATVEECFEDRVNRRAEWYRLIRDFNRPDPSALGRAIFEEHDVYCGLRSKAELHALMNARAVDFVIWVDRSDNVAPEGRDSCTVEPWMAHYVLDNNGTLEDLEFNVRQLMSTILEEESE